MLYSDVLRHQEQTVNDNSLHKLESLIQNQIEQTNKLSQYDVSFNNKIMQPNLKIAIWNANGLSNHTQEVEIFLKTYFIDIFLVSETHFTDRSYKYCKYHLTYIHT